MTDSVTKPRYHGVLDAYKQVWTETWNPQKGVASNSLARIKNFYRVRLYGFQRAFKDGLTDTGCCTCCSSGVPDERRGAGSLRGSDALFHTCSLESRYLHLYSYVTLGYTFGRPICSVRVRRDQDTLTALISATRCGTS
jgi:hypothetical protein